MEQTASGVVIVGTNGTAASDAALAFAIDEVARSGDQLEMITAWDAPTRR